MNLGVPQLNQSSIKYSGSFEASNSEAHLRDLIQNPEAQREVAEFKFVPGKILNFRR